MTRYHEAFYSDIDAEIQEQAKRADEGEYLNKNNAPDNTDYLEAYINYVLKIIKLLPDYSNYNEATIRHNIDLVLKKAQNKDSVKNGVIDRVSEVSQEKKIKDMARNPKATAKEIARRGVVAYIQESYDEFSEEQITKIDNMK